MNSRWLILSAFACALVAPAAAQPPAPGLGINSIAHVALRVSDVDREIAFLGKLGYEESFAVNAGQVMEVFVKINDRQFIELYPRTDPKQPLGFLHACYEAGDLNALVKYYRSLGLSAAPARKAGSGNLISVINDPAGYVTEFTQYMPGSRHTLDRGLHLGANRIATELMGVDLPVNNLAAEKQFYVQLGFDAENGGNDIHLTAPGAPDLRVELRPAHPGALPQLLFPVDDARRAADRLKEFRPARDKGIFVVHDPDGNSFVFLETGGGHKDRFMPWKH